MGRECVGGALRKCPNKQYCCPVAKDKENLEVEFSSLSSVKGLMLVNLSRSHFGQVKHWQSVDQQMSLRKVKVALNVIFLNFANSCV